MDSTSIDLTDSQITAVVIEGHSIKVCLKPACLIKTMTGSVERTRWQQRIDLVFTQAELPADLVLPDFPNTCVGGDLNDNVYTYRDMIPLPLESRGTISCYLRLAGDAAPIRIQAGAVRLEPQGIAKYIEHIKATYIRHSV